MKMRQRDKRNFKIRFMLSRFGQTYKAHKPTQSPNEQQKQNTTLFVRCRFWGYTKIFSPPHLIFLEGTAASTKNWHSSWLRFALIAVAAWCPRLAPQQARNMFSRVSGAQSEKFKKEKFKKVLFRDA
jgi:hypothetical protein